MATVVNIDWPSKQKLSSQAQQQELIKLLDEHQKSGINAIMLQVRPTADAFYAKGIEPWSKWLSGKQGVAPYPFYDPLEFAITEAHKRGMELHAWFNPYRATMSLSDADVSADHITKTHPEWFFTYGTQKLFNPGLPEVRNYIVQVIMSVVKNYDVDGIHFDDYFYPYPISGRAIPDTESYIKYGRDFRNITDWRRSNVDTLIKTLNDSIHVAKKHVKFGISPFGIWKNRAQDPEGSVTNGGSSYIEHYADTRKWLREEWVDYINPQIYWPFQHRLAAFENLVEWWSNNSNTRHLYIGQAAYRAAENVQGFRNRAEIPNQIRYLRENPRVQGSVYFSSKSLTNNLAGLQDSLRQNVYQYPALPPTMLWLDHIPPHSPTELTSQLSAGNVVLNWKKPTVSRDGETAYGYVVYRFNSDEEVNLEDGSKILKISFEDNLTSYTDTSALPGKGYQYLVTAIDRIKNESLPSNSVLVFKN